MKSLVETAVFPVPMARKNFVTTSVSKETRVIPEQFIVQLEDILGRGETVILDVARPLVTVGAPA